uniref:Major facilitator superfamily domain containing 4A n=1 Tax=Periophthalmus magnuspinnatus TaxID=409849 RepID=A0A3B3ZUH6_9GOBI
MFVDERIVTLFKRNAHHTLTYWSVFFSFGLCIAFLGPTILDLQCQTKSSLSEITWVFFAQQFCLLVGSSVGGVFKRTLVSALSALFVSALIISIIFAIIPWCTNVLMLAVAMAVSGLAMGVIDTIANIQLVTIYQKDSAVFLQALHFFIGFGALVSPLIADPFLSESGCGNHTANETEMIHHFRNLLRHSPIVEHNITQSTAPPHGEEESSVQYAFWIMALINAGAIVTVLMLLIFYTSSVFLFVGTCLCGLFLSSIFPCMLSYTEDILDYQGCATSVLVTSAGMGEMVMQVLVGQIIQTKGSYSFLLCGVVIACVGFIVFIGLLLFHRMHRNYLTGNTHLLRLRSLR